MTLATYNDAVREFAWNAGQDQTDRAWLLHDLDVWVANPHYTGAPVPHPEDQEAHAPDGLIEDAASAFAIVVGGNATFTIKSARTGDRFTYRVRVAKDNPGRFFVSTLIGSDNETDYAYIGFFNTMHGGRVLCSTSGACLLPGKKGKPDDVRFKALDWLLDALRRDHLPLTVEFWHEGRCARCARKLTDPESIARGFGPECATKA